MLPMCRPMVSSSLMIACSQRASPGHERAPSDRTEGRAVYHRSHARHPDGGGGVERARVGACQAAREDRRLLAGHVAVALALAVAVNDAGKSTRLSDVDVDVNVDVDVSVDGDCALTAKPTTTWPSSGRTPRAHLDRSRLRHLLAPRSINGSVNVAAEARGSCGVVVVDQQDPAAGPCMRWPNTEHNDSQTLGAAPAFQRSPSPRR
jgi:hypothetical protein